VLIISQDGIWDIYGMTTTWIILTCLFLWLSIRHILSYFSKIKVCKACQVMKEEDDKSVFLDSKLNFMDENVNKMIKDGRWKDIISAIGYFLSAIACFINIFVL